MADVYRAAAPRTLGAVERKHASPPPVRPIAIFFVIFGLPGVALLGGFQSGQGQVFAGDRATNGAIGAALLGFAVYLAILAVRKATLRVTVHENGLRWVENGKTRNVFWEDVASITGAHRSRRVAGEEIARTDVHRLTLDDGRVLVMTNMLSNVGTLAERIERALMARLLPTAREDLIAGRTVAFGPIAVSKDRVVVDKRTIERPAIVNVVDGVITIDDGSASASVSWREVPNARVLLALLDRAE